ncbi:porin [Aliivibrio fischeri]|uniref:Porin domain-containing protein n=2 Tax=Aliivibrio fischeri TaxID=668 RepID=A0A510UDF7_ALIFS|nr:porin [Aliivibrio fischeri]EHN70659.1 porin-like protein H precursor [Aliivibrio fischeri SR5]MUK64999.1 porin [Aliivibrio fischeri]USR96463.1 porin [Aliivibrio fischeri ATCC 7744 = JCM 18803 = DSM 507]GEK12632.1 hypothetical protein AFI02nite_06680 [Aliivibrio fischeri]GGK23237.1 hypothetical protein GCM10007987_03930 [Aliivibrio fischeri]
MKKTLVALSVLAAGSAQAGIELYNQNDVTVNMGGDIEVVYKQGKAEDAELTQEIQDADVSFDVRYAINDELQFGGFWQINDVAMDKDGENAGDVYVALYSDTVGSFKVGRLCTVLDDAGIGSDYQFGITTFFQGEDMYCADEVIRWDIDKENFYAAAAIAQDKNGNTGLNNDSTYFDGKIGYRVADFDFTALVGLGEVGGDLPTSTKHDETLWSAQVRYNGIDNLGLAAAYYSMDNDTDTTNTMALAATYQLDLLALAAGYSLSSHDDDAIDDLNTWYVNAGYTVAPNTTAYVEVGGDDADKTQTGFAIGVKAAF